MSKQLSILISLLFASTMLLAQDDESSCIGCHIEQDPPISTPAEIVMADVHQQAGFGCEDCHGGDAEAWDYDEAKDPATGFIGIPSGKEIVEVCGKCHADPGFMRTYNPNLPTDQVEKYWTSKHGKGLLAGNQDVADCSACHTAHAIKPASDPGSTVYHVNVVETCGGCHGDYNLMQKYDMPTAVVSQYKASVHGVALLEHGDRAAPTCNNCHGNHGATPPDVASTQEVCGTCHVNNQRLFSETKMQSAFKAKGGHGCAVCHTAHDIHTLSDDLVSTKPGAKCAECHTSKDPGGMQADSIHAALTGLTSAIAVAEEKIRATETNGLEVGELLLDLQNAHTAQVQARTLIHGFNAERVRETTFKGVEIAEKIIVEADRLLDGFRVTRFGLGVFTILITFMVIVLYLYIRTLS